MREGRRRKGVATRATADPGLASSPSGRLLRCLHLAHGGLRRPVSSHVVDPRQLSARPRLIGRLAPGRRHPACVLLK